MEKEMTQKEKLIQAQQNEKEYGWDQLSGGEQALLLGWDQDDETDPAGGHGLHSHI